MIMTVFACIATVASCILTPDYASACPRVHHQVIVQQAPDGHTINDLFVEEEFIPMGRVIIGRIKKTPEKRPETYIVE